MKLSADHPFARLVKTVMVDGGVVESVQSFDEDSGEVVAFVVDQDGNAQLNETKDGLLTKVHRGKITVDWRTVDGKPPWLSADMRCHYAI